ncbi:hypothetical protein FHR66_002864 [Xanthomonas sp. F4]
MRGQARRRSIGSHTFAAGERHAAPFSQTLDAASPPTPPATTPTYRSATAAYERDDRGVKHDLAQDESAIGRRCQHSDTDGRWRHRYALGFDPGEPHGVQHRRDAGDGALRTRAATHRTRHGQERYTVKPAAPRHAPHMAMQSRRPRQGPTPPLDQQGLRLGLEGTESRKSVLRQRLSAVENIHTGHHRCKESPTMTHIPPHLPSWPALSCSIATLEHAATSSRRTFPGDSE